VIADGRLRWRSIRAGIGASTRAPRGFALVLVLWVLAFLSIISVVLVRQAREETQFEHATIEDSKAEALAEGGVQRAMAGLLSPDPAESWPADGRPHQIRLGEGTVEIRIEDESGKIDLNRADDATLESLLVSVGMAPGEARKLAAAIADYQDPDNVKRPGGAEAADYEQAGLNRRPKNGPFDDTQELLQVLGMTPELMRALDSMITVHSPVATVNLAAASPAVLRALPGIDEAQRQQIQATQSGGGAISVPLVVMVIAAATTDGGGHFIREAILRRTTNPMRPYDTLSWCRRWLDAVAPSE